MLAQRSLNILVLIGLFFAFFAAGRSVVQTFPVAAMTALNNLQPEPQDYFLDLYVRQGTPDKNRVRCFADYYEHLLRVFPNLWDAYGMLGYCYHYLNDDPKAIEFLKTAIDHDPDYFWNYYNLAAIYFKEARYRESFALLQRALGLAPVESLKRIFASSMVYRPLLGDDEKKAFAYAAGHLKDTYRGGFIIMQVLDQAAGNKDAQKLVKRINPELYAF